MIHALGSTCRRRHRDCVYGGNEVKVDGEELLVLREEDVMAVIEK
jgi:hypothetical protein